MGFGSEHSVHMTIASLVGTALRAFTYDAPVVTFPSVSNGAASGNTPIVISGMNYGFSDLSLTARVGASACTTSKWVTDTALSCTLAVGAGMQHSAAVTASRMVGSQSLVFTYDSPAVTSVALTNAAGSGGVYVTVTGTNFGVDNLSGVVKLGDTACATVVWNSGSQMRCLLVPSANGVALHSSVEISALVGTGLKMFTYDSPVLTYTSGMNVATTGGIVVTVTGTNFGSQDFGGSASLGSTACSATTFFSDTSVSCAVPSGTGRARLVFSQTGLSNTKLLAFTYDAPVVTYSAPHNGPTKAGAVVTVEGTNFGPVGSSSTALVGVSFCYNSEWLTTTSIKCITPSGTKIDHQLNVAMNGMVGTMNKRFSYDAPVLSGLSMANGPLDGVALTLSGVNFGALDESMTVVVGTTQCTSVGWSSDSSVVCTTPTAGSASTRRRGAAMAVTVTLGGASSSPLPAAFSHDAPAVIGFGPTNGPAAGGATITISGGNLGGAGTSPVASVGGVPCTATSYVSATSMLCTQPPSSGSFQSVALTVSGVIGTGLGVFTYDSPSLAAVSPANGLYIGQTQLTVTGSNFGSSTVASVGGTACAATTYVTGTSVTCLTPPASMTYSSAVDVAVSVGTETSTLASAYSFNPPGVGPGLPISGLSPALNATSTLVMQVTNATTYSQYKFTQATAPTLAGSLYVEFAPGYIPARSQPFTFLQQEGTGTFAGSFASITSNIPNTTSVVTPGPGTWSVQIQVPGCNVTLACNGHGTCQSDTTGECVCDTGYGGAECETACFYVSATASWNCGCSTNLPGGS